MRQPRQPHLSQSDYERLASFRYVLRRFINFSAEAAKGVGLTTHQHQALLAIKASRETMTIGELADHMMIAPHTAAELVARLVAAELLSRVKDPSDGRRVGLALTPRANRALSRLSLVHMEELEALEPKLMGILRGAQNRLDNSSGLVT